MGGQLRFISGRPAGGQQFLGASGERQCLLALAGGALARKDAAGAEAWLAKVPEQHPARVEADNLAGLCKLEREDPYGALQLFKSVVERRPEARHARVNMAYAYLKAGRSTDARAAAEKAVAGLPPDHPLAKHAAALVPAGPGGTP